MGLNVLYSLGERIADDRPNGPRCFSRGRGQDWSLARSDPIDMQATLSSRLQGRLLQATASSKKG
jgi:hypothetical protein